MFDGTACSTTSLLHWRHDTVICVMVSDRSWGEEEQARQGNGGGRVRSRSIMYMYDNVMT